MELRTQHGDRVYEPAVHEGVTLTREKNKPSLLEFTVQMDSGYVVEEGDAVSLIAYELYPYNVGHKIFYGFVFRLSPNKNGALTVLAYDQVRYLLSSDTYVYANKTLHELLWMICDDVLINYGPDIENTEYVIESRVEDNKTYLDMLMSAISITKSNTENEYVLWDNYGEMALHYVEFFKLGTLIDSETGEDFSFETSIDSETYNQVKLIRENQDGNRDVFLKRDEESIKKWGLLQYFETVGDDEDGNAKAQSLLNLKNRRSRSMRVSGAFGDIRVRGGTQLPVKLNMGNGHSVDDFMTVRKVTHRFINGYHTMDLELTGGNYGG